MTNREHYDLPQGDEVATRMEYQTECRRTGCINCRHDYTRRPHPDRTMCTEAWAESTFGQPMDIRIPWPPETEPNPL